MLQLDAYKEELKEFVRLEKDLFEGYRGKAVLISGAAGLIGSYIVDLFCIANQMLDLQVVVYAVDKNRELLDERFSAIVDNGINIICADVNEQMINAEVIDYVIHAASNTSPVDYATKPIDTICTNVMGTNNMLKLCINNNVKRFMFCSSVEAYGQNNGDVDEFNEDYSGYVNCNTLRAGYPSAKRAAEALCNAYAGEYPDFEFVVARIGRIYGPTIIENDSKAPSQFINNAVLGEDIVMKSDGMQEFSYAYVGDCAVAMLYILLNGNAGEAYNIADPKSNVRLRDFAESAALAGGTRVVFRQPSLTEKQGYSKITKATMDTTKLQKLGWSAKYQIKDGVKRTVDFLKQMKGIL